MSVYVDSLFVMEAKGSGAFLVGKRNGHQWCHMLADTTEELCAMADKLGLQRKWLQDGGEATEHFDLTPQRRAAAVAAGAIEVDRRGLVGIIRKKRGTP